MILDRRFILIAGIPVVIAISLFIATSLRTEKAVTPTPAPTPPTEETTPQTTSFPLSSATVDNLKSQATQEYSFATGLAKEWREDAVFVAALVEYSGSVDPKNGKNTYIFSSATLPAFYWTVIINQARGDDGKNTYERLIRYKEDFTLDSTTIEAPLQYWKISYLDALNRLEAMGAPEIRAKNPNYSVTLLLSAQQNRYLAWDAEYKVGARTLLRKTLNAATGEELATNQLEE